MYATTARGEDDSVAGLYTPEPGEYSAAKARGNLLEHLEGFPGEYHQQQSTPQKPEEQQWLDKVERLLNSAILSSKKLLNILLQSTKIFATLLK